jgi:hypothetical protein
MISKSTIRLLAAMKEKIDTYQPSYCGDHLVDRVYIMENEPVYCVQIVRETGEEFYNLTWDYSIKNDDWNKHLDSIIVALDVWLESEIKGIYAYAYGYCHTIDESLGENGVIPKERIPRDKRELILLINSFRREIF